MLVLKNAVAIECQTSSVPVYIRVHRGIYPTFVFSNCYFTLFSTIDLHTQIVYTDGRDVMSYHSEKPRKAADCHTVVDAL